MPPRGNGGLSHHSSTLSSRPSLSSQSPAPFTPAAKRKRGSLTYNPLPDGDTIHVACKKQKHDDPDDEYDGASTQPSSQAFKYTVGAREIAAIRTTSSSQTIYPSSTNPSSPTVPDSQEEEEEADDDIHLDVEALDQRNFFSQGYNAAAPLSLGDADLDSDNDAPNLYRAGKKREYEKAIYEALADEAQVPTCTENCQYYLDLLYDNAHAFDETFVRHELAEQNTLGDVDKDAAIGYTRLIRMTTTPLIHDAILRCELPRRHLTDPKLRDEIAEVDKYCQKVPKQPRIYANYLCNSKTADTMSANQMESVVENLRRYVFDDDYAAVIDNVKSPKVPMVRRRPLKIPSHTDTVQEHTKKGFRKYLSTSSGNAAMSLPALARVERLGVFCRAMLRRIAAIPQHVNDPQHLTAVQFLTSVL